MVRVGVVIPTYRRPVQLVTSVKAVLGQTDAEVEVVVVDDAGHDHATDLVLDELAGDGVRTVVRSTSGGPAMARNTGAATLDTEYVAFCDDDDVWAPVKVARQVAALSAHPEAGWAYGGALHFEVGRGPRYAAVPPALGVHDPTRALLDFDVVPGGGSGVVVRRGLFEELGGFDVEFHGTEDWDLYLRLASAAPAVALNEPLVAYRVEPCSQVSGEPNRMAAQCELFLAKHADRRAEAGCAAWPDRVEGYIAGIDLLAGRHRQSARRQLRRFGQTRSPRALLSAALAAGAPILARRVSAAISRRSIPAGWARDTMAWLTPMLEAEQARAASVSRRNP